MEWDADLIPCSSDGYLILGSGMAVHSFSSIGEIHQAEPEKREEVRTKVLAESRTFDTELRNAVTKPNAVERRQALLALESLHEFRSSHPTVEVRVTTASGYIKGLLQYRLIPQLALHASPCGSWIGRGCICGSSWGRCCRAGHVIPQYSVQIV